MPRIRWTPALVERRIREAAEQLGIDHMPTAAQLRSLDGGNSLACRVSRSLGFDGWADRLGLPRALHNSRDGWRGEALFRETCANRGIQTRARDRVKAPSDMTANGVDVEVKTSSFRDYGRVKGWTFNLHNKCLAPVLAALCLVGEELRRLYLIPRESLPGSTLSISPSCPTYAPYLNAWHLLEGN